MVCSFLNGDEEKGKAIIAGRRQGGLLWVGTGEKQVRILVCAAGGYYVWVLGISPQLGGGGQWAIWKSKLKQEYALICTEGACYTEPEDGTWPCFSTTADTCGKMMQVKAGKMLIRVVGNCYT